MKKTFLHFHLLILLSLGIQSSFGQAGTIPLDEATLKTKPIFKTLEEAQANPAEAYRLALNIVGEIPEGLGKLNNLQQLKISSMGGRPVEFTHLPNDLASLTKLTSLEISNTGIQSLPTGLGKLKSLKTLILSNNKLTSLSTEVYLLTNLSELIIKERTCNITTDLSKLTNLKKLTTSAQQLPVLPGIKELTYIANMPMIPPGIASYTGLEKLVISSSMPVEIRMLLDKASAFTNLKVLDISSANIGQMEFEALGKLPKLQILKIGQVMSFPPTITGFMEIKEFGFAKLMTQDQTQLRTFYSQLANFKNLEKISGPFIQGMDEFFHRMKEVSVVYSPSNGENTLALLANVQNLKCLILRDDLVSEFPEVLSTIPNIKTLDISQIQIVNFDEALNIICKMNQLEHLIVSGSNMTMVSPSISCLNRLKTLEIITVSRPGMEMQDLRPEQLEMLSTMLKTTEIIY